MLNCITHVCILYPSSKTDPEPRWDIVKTRASTVDNYRDKLDTDYIKEINLDKIIDQKILQ